MTISEKKRKSLTLISMTCMMSLIFLNATLFPVALPTIQKELFLSGLEIQWIINAYLLAISAFVIAGGRLADIFGHRRLFCIGVTIYTIASLMGSIGQVGWWLIMSRAIQGTGGAMMSPAGMSIIIQTFPEKERGKAVGIIVGIGSLFLSLGPLIGGVFTEYLSWRFAFLINLPIALLGIYLTLSIIPKSKIKNENFDFLGFFTLSPAIICLTLGLMQGKVWGWGSPKVVFLFLLSLCFFISVRGFSSFVRYPLVEFNLFKNRLFLGGSIIILCVQFILMIMVFWPIYLQWIIMDSPMVSGMITAIGSIPLILFAPLSGSLADKKGTQLPVRIGFICLICALMWFSYFLKYANIALLFPALFVFGAGASMVMTPISSATISSVPQTKTGLATGMYNTLRFIGATIGVAVLGAIQLNIQTSLFTQALKNNPETNRLNVTLFEGILNKLPKSIEASNQLSGTVLEYVQTSLIYAASMAFSIAHLVAGVVACFALIITFIFFRKKR